MNTHTTTLDLERLHTLAARMRAWVLALVGWLAGFEGVLPRAWRRELLVLVRGAEIDVRRLVICVAVAGLPPALPPSMVRRAPRPRSTPPGFRRMRHHGDEMRPFVRGVRLTDARGRRGSLAVRIARVRAILARLGWHAAAMRRRIARMKISARLTPVAPRADRLVALAAPACVCADTS